jgi:hypothetical protein
MVKIENEVLKVHGRYWLVREAIATRCALDCIAMASVTGSVGGKDVVHNGGVETVLADVVELVERKPG